MGILTDLNWAEVVDWLSRLDFLWDFCGRWIVELILRHTLLGWWKKEMPVDKKRKKRKK